MCLRNQLSQLGRTTYAETLSSLTCTQDTLCLSYLTKTHITHFIVQLLKKCDMEDILYNHITVNLRNYITYTCMCNFNRMPLLF